MEIWQGILLGAVQGLTEFLPVSSSGHLLLIERWMGLDASSAGVFFDVMLHIATLIPVVIVLFKQILSLFKKPFNKLLYLLIATIPAVITGIFLENVIEGYFKGGAVLSACLLGGTFLLTAGELLAAEIVSKKKNKSLPLSYANTAVMGVAQGLAVVPGLSRSGTVISAGSFMGLNREQNANFTFLMSIPVILGAAALSGYKVIKNGSPIYIWPLILGMLTAMLTGYIAIKFMLKIIKKANYKWFSLYLVLIAIASVITKVAFGV